MCPKKTAALAFVLAMTAVVGCSLNRSAELRQTNLLTRIGQNGQVIEPKRCMLTVAILSRPLNDEAINSALWRVVDEQVVEPDARRALRDNGLRLGLLSGDLPAEVDAVLKAPPPHKVEPAKYVLPDGQNTLIAAAAATPEVSLLLNDKDHARGKDYQDACGFFRMTARFDGPAAVALRLVPEIHHGPVQHTFGAVPTTGGVASPNQFTIKDGQQEDTLRELAATLALRPDQVAVIGCLPERPRSLGSFLLTQTEPNSDRVLQRVILVWAVRNQTGQLPAETEPGVLPKLTPVEPPK